MFVEGAEGPDPGHLQAQLVDFHGPWSTWLSDIMAVLADVPVAYCQQSPFDETSRHRASGYRDAHQREGDQMHLHVFFPLV